MKKTEKWYGISTGSTLKEFTIRKTKLECIQDFLVGRSQGWDYFNSEGFECIPVEITYEVKE